MNFEVLKSDFEALKSNFEALESDFEVGHDGFRRVLRQGMTKATIGVARQIWLGWPAPPHVVDGGGLRQQHCV